MDKKQLKDLLSAHADHLVGHSDGDDTAESSLPADSDEELSALLDVAHQVKSTLTPITPATNFEAELKRELLTTAHLRRAEGYVPPNPERDLLILMAVVGFVLSLAGVLLALRLRSQGI